MLDTSFTENYLSFDIEDWFHLLELDNQRYSEPKNWHTFESRVEYITYLILDILNDQKVKANFFILSWVAKKYPKLISDIADAGHLIGSHTHTHKIIHQLNYREFDEELRVSKEIIENITGRSVVAFRAPGFSITKNCLWAFDVLVKNEIQIDSSLFNGDRAHGGLNLKVNYPFMIKTNNGTIVEFPIPKFNFVLIRAHLTGGGYLRVCPHRLLTYICRRQKYTNVYLHPRDIDHNQPKIKDLKPLRYFKTYVGINTARKKLESLTSQMSWA